MTPANPTELRKLRILDGVEFIEAPTFTAMVAGYLEDDEYRALQLFLAGDPEAGDVMPGTGGFRKLRWADRRRGKGKRGGLRVMLLLPFGRCSDLVDDALRQRRNGRPDAAKEKRALKAKIEAENLRGVPHGAGYEGNELWQRRSDRWFERSAASSGSSCRVWKLCGITAKGGSL